MARTYAEIIDGVVRYVGECEDGFVPQFAAPIECVLCDEATGTPNEGDLWDGAAFAPAPPPTQTYYFQIEIDEIATDDPDGSVDGLDVTCAVGSTVTIQCHATPPLTDWFRMPLVATDGRTKVKRVAFSAGAGTITWRVTESAIWEVIESRINEGMPPGMTMHVPRIRVFAVE